MKKTVFVISLAFVVSSAFAQDLTSKTKDLTSKKGELILPEAGDWAISMNVDPIFQFVGNAFSGSNAVNTAPGVGFLNGNQTIIGKMFIDEKSAYRVLVRIGFTDQTNKNFVNDDKVVPPNPIFPAPYPQVEDKLSMKKTSIAIGAGKEWRRGTTRLQGYYGADAMIWIASSSNTYTYGNAMTAVAAPGVTPTPTSTTWDANTGAITSPPGGSALGSRPLSTTSGMTFGIGVRGFIGAEYFIMPKIALGAEFGWGIGFQSTGKGSLTTETTGTSGTPPVASVAQQKTQTDGSSKFGFDTDLNQGTIFGFKGSNNGTASLKATFHF